MNIAIGKFGRSSFFNKERWSIYAGDDSPYIIYTTLAKRFPEHTFYFIGGNDLDKCRKKELEPKHVGFEKYINPDKEIIDNSIPKNIIDLYHISLDKAKKNNIERHDALVEILIENNIHIDFGIFLQGPDQSTTLNNKGIVCKTDFTRNAIPMQMAKNYSAPIVHCVNYFGFPWIVVNEDPRYVPINTRDIYNNEIEILSQINTKYKVSRCKGYNEDSKIFIDHILNYKYAGIEKMFLTDTKKVDFRNPNNIIVNNKIYSKKNNFIMTLNGSPDRFNFVKEWIFAFDSNQIIYGKWDNAIIEDYSKNFIHKGISEIEDLMWETKFTYIPCFEKRLSNFVTQKVWKMIYYGIIPFWDKNSYDTDNYYTDIPDYFKVSSPEEMWNKINFLNENDDLYKKYLEIYYNLLDDKYFNGDFIVDTFKPYIDKYNK